MDENEKIDRIVNVADVPLAHPKWRDRLDYFLVAAVALLGVGLIVAWMVATQANSESDQNHRKLGQVSTALADANHQILRLGGTPVKTPVPTGVVTKPATDSQIFSQVAAYFSLHPVPSPVIDYATLHAYVIDYLERHPAARGVRGAPGASGSPGESGANGPSGSPGPGPTQGEIASAVSAYFHDHPPQPGPTGPTGPAGSDGRGLVKVDCSSTALPLESFTFTLTYSDGTVQTVTCNDGSPTPSPTP